ncbi:unnamed protein product [Meloidogyne enterolobii]|uniref:Uncharacterized protein n=1 Tax=Meloidogyne enterolobii TaxID=390850 RepID=A0ACB1AWF0_MELEN
MFKLMSVMMFCKFFTLKKFFLINCFLKDSDYRYKVGEFLFKNYFLVKWDKYLMTTTRIGYLDQNNDVCYYTVGSLPPFRNRDFVLLRSWADLGKEKFILAHSVWHDVFFYILVRKSIVRKK